MPHSCYYVYEVLLSQPTNSKGIRGHRESGYWRGVFIVKKHCKNQGKREKKNPYHQMLLTVHKMKD